MTQQSTRKLPEPIQIFVENLAKLTPGERAMLKRNAGNRLSESQGGVMGLFYEQVFPYNAAEKYEDWYFLVATLYPLEKESIHSTLPNSFGGSLQQVVRTNENENGLNRRMKRLLDADKQQLHFLLRQATLYIFSQRGRINWGYLLDDLTRWTWPSRPVQRTWAQDYFANQSNH